MSKKMTKRNNQQPSVFAGKMFFNGNLTLLWKMASLVRWYVLTQQTVKLSENIFMFVAITYIPSYLHISCYSWLVPIKHPTIPPNSPWDTTNSAFLVKFPWNAPLPSLPSSKRFCCASFSSRARRADEASWSLTCGAMGWWLNVDSKGDIFQ